MAIYAKQPPPLGKRSITRKEEKKVGLRLPQSLKANCVTQPTSIHQISQPAQIIVCPFPSSCRTCFSRVFYWPSDQRDNPKVDQGGGSSLHIHFFFLFLGGEVIEQDRALLTLLAPVPHHDARAVDHFSSIAFAVQHACENIQHQCVSREGPISLFCQARFLHR